MQKDFPSQNYIVSFKQRYNLSIGAKILEQKFKRTKSIRGID